MPSDIELLSDAPASADAPAEPATTDTPESVTPEGGTAPDAPVDEPVVDPAAAAPAAPAVDPNAAPVEEDELLAQPEVALEDPLTIKALSEKIGKSPELQAAIAKDPGLKNLLYSTSRLAAQANEFKSIVQTPELARTALELADRYINLENTLRSEPGKAPDSLFELTAIRDAQGNILFDQPNEAYTSLFVTQREQHLWPFLAEMAAKSGNEDWRDAVAIVAHQMLGDKIQIDSPFAKAGGAQAPQGKQQPQLPPEVQERLRKLDELERGQQDAAQNEQRQYGQNVANNIHESVSKAANGYLDNLIKAQPNAMITDFTKEAVIEKALKEIYELAKNDPNYQRHINFIYKSASVKDAALSQKLVAEATKYARERMPRLIAKHLGEASKGVVKQQQQRSQKQQDQKERPNVQGNAGASAPSRPDPAARVKEFMAKNKRKPSDREIMDL